MQCSLIILRSLITVPGTIYLLSSAVIQLLVRGKAHCEWKVFVSGLRRIIKDDQYFIDERTEIWAPTCGYDENDAEEEGDDQTESDQQDNEKSLVKEGIHEFQFSFRLSDANIPCSLESRACSIRYHLRAILDVPEADDIPQGVKYFTILGPIIDCNDNKFLVSDRKCVLEDSQRFLFPSLRIRCLDRRSVGATASAVANNQPRCAAFWTDRPIAQERR